MRILPLLPHHEPIVAELLAHYSVAELLELTAQLPWLPEAAEALLPAQKYPYLRLTAWHPSTWRMFLQKRSTPPALIAAYVAAAADGGVSRAVEDVLATLARLSRSRRGWSVRRVAPRCPPR
jgi:hypothetical protein